MSYHVTALLFLLHMFTINAEENNTSASTPHTQCEGSMLDWWNKEVQPGQRGFVLQMREEPDGLEFHCLAKGENSEMMDPVVLNTAKNAMFRQASKMPCKFAEEYMEATYVSSSNGTTAACGVFNTSGCYYPNESEGQNDWGGPQFKISMVNDFHTTVGQNSPGVAYQSPYNRIYSNFSHGGVFGTPGTYCQLNSNTFLYNASMVLSTQTLDNMKYKIYAFSSEEQRLAALSDGDNEGLQYATEMKGENGCDIEILYEFKPMSGGGISLNPSQTFNDEKLQDSSSAYMIEETATAIMMVNKTVVRQSQFLPPQECDNGTLKTLKFSSQFVCKSTGQKVNITEIKFKGADGNEVYLSRDPNNPSYFQDPNNIITNFTNAPDLFMRIDASYAPESCEWMYWDPLVANLPGNGNGVRLTGSISSFDENSSFDVKLILIFSVCFVVLGSIAYYWYTRSMSKISEQSGSIEATHTYQEANSEADSTIYSKSRVHIEN